VFKLDKERLIDENIMLLKGVATVTSKQNVKSF